MNDWVEEDLTLVETDQPNEVPIKAFATWSYWRTDARHMYDSLEDAREGLLKEMKKSPFSTSKHYIVEIKEVLQNFPKAEVETKILDVTQYVEDEQKRIESNES